jgi:SNF2 family DNA or RNA helicase
MKVHYADGELQLAAAPYEADLAKQIPGARWHEPTQTWRLAATWPALCAVEGVLRANMEPTPDLMAWRDALVTDKIDPLLKLRLMEDLGLSGPTAERLWPLQRVGCYAMVLAERYILGDEMGGGKTRTTLAAMKMAAAMHGKEQVFPALVVCPNKVRRTWRKQALEGENGEEAFWPELRLEVLPKQAAKKKAMLARVAAGEIDVLVMNWEAVAGLSRLEPFGNIEMTEKEKTPGPLNAIQWQTLVADEAHRAKDRRAKQTRAIKAVAFGTKACKTGPTRFRWPLTGTIVGNNSADVWSVNNLMDPDAWPAYSRFVDRYAATTWNNFGGLDIGGVKPENRDEFYLAFFPSFMRRLRSQFDKDKPERLRQTYTVEMEPKQATAYKAMAKDMLAELDGEVLFATNPMVKASRLWMLAQGFAEMVDKGRRDEFGEPILDMSLKAPSNKVKAMLELVEEAGITPGVSTDGIPIVFGAVSRQLIGLCEEALIKAKIPYALIAGGMTDREQEENERKFESGQAKVALCVIEAAKEGLNSLVAAPTLVFLQKSFSRIANEQFEARVDRPGQKAKAVTIIEVASEGTLEEFDQIAKLSAKAQSFQEVVNDEGTLRAILAFKGEEV